MANTETKQLDAIISSRRQLLAIGGVALAGLAFAPKAQAAAAVTDNDILNFALNLEYLEAQFYNLAANGVTIDNLPSPIPVAVNGGTAGTVTLKPSFAAVPFSSTLIKNYALETAVEEGKHVLFLQSALGKNAVSMPNIDLYNSFNGLATLAGLGSAFDPFASDANFLIGAYIFEDVGVSAYGGAAALISDKTVVLPAAAGILAVEAYHAGLVRTSINELDAGAGVLTGYTQAISTARATLANGSGGTVDDIGVTTAMVALNGSSATYPALTIADASTDHSLAFTRSTTQVLAIVTAGGVTTGGTTKYTGAFFPAGLNGTIS
ncbi:ferritin-like domain-containing protein [Granulicella sibirica]|uniref:Dessication-associated protein n=1 Tax=Granulicella sibirica TaxID=2479048 RepID=A0A4Q0SZM2_9BACT|nr:ferritin-like domain-containing protein [Granulicella sibirica]RXH55490.1 Dessication-associated protein [Granulicella sibirica]